MFLKQDATHTNDNTHSAQDTIKIKRRKKYNFHAPKAVLMSSNTWKLQFSDMTNAIDNLDNQGIIDLDDVYQKLCNIIVTEMDMCLESRNVGSNSHMGRRRNHKPYWSEELTEFWNDMRETERDYLTCHTSREQINVLRRAFIYAQKTFDKKLKQAERAYNRLEIHSIDTLNKSNPKAFWNYVNSLGPRKNLQIPLTVLVNDVPVDDLTSVLEVWRDEFHKLYTKSDDAVDNSVGYLEMLVHKRRLESSMAEVNYETNVYLNQKIDFEEVVICTSNAKSNKATGLDAIPNEVLHQFDMQIMLYKLFSFIFDKAIAPSLWLKAIVHPIYKGGGKDPRSPMSYRGISLLSCVYKVYTALLNRRIVKYCDELNILVDEQNGFRKGRSCDDVHFDQYPEKSDCGKTIYVCNVH